MDGMAIMWIFRIQSNSTQAKIQDNERGWWRCPADPWKLSGPGGVSKKHCSNHCFFLNTVNLSIFELSGAVVRRPAIFGRGRLICFLILLTAETIGTTGISAPDA